MKRLAKAIIPGPLWTKLRLWRLHRHLETYPTRIAKHRYHGFPLSVHIADCLSEGWYDRDWRPLPELDFLTGHGLGAGATVYDFGAHQGVFAMILARIVGEQGKVIAYEANRHNYEVGCKNRDINEIGQLHLVHGAIAEQPGSAIFNEGLNGEIDDGSGSWGRVRVDAYSIDQAVGQGDAVDLIAMDIEGFEGPALRGARNTLKKEINWFIEMHGEKILKFGSTPEEIMAAFPVNRFDVYSGTEVLPFQPISQRPPNTKQRFFLIAICKHEQITELDGTSRQST